MNDTYRDEATGISVERKDHDPPVYLIGKAGRLIRLTEMEATVVVEFLVELGIESFWGPDHA